MSNSLSKPKLCIVSEEDDSDSEGERRHQCRLSVRRFIQRYEQRTASREELQRLERRRRELIDFLACGQEDVCQAPVPCRHFGSQTDVSWCASVCTQTPGPMVRTSEIQTSQPSQADVQTQTKIKEC